MMMFRNAAILLLSAILPFSGATNLTPGDLHIVAYRSDNPDAFAFVTWVDIDEGTQIHFTDNGWGCDNGGGFASSSEAVITYTTPTGGVSAGSVHTFWDGSTGSEWSTSGSVSLSIYGDQLIAYQGTFENPTPIYAFDSTGGWEDCNGSTGSKYSVLPDGLVDGESAVSFDHKDNYWYRPWYATSATLTTLKQWMVNVDRFMAWNTKQFTMDDIPDSFTILTGETGASGYTEYIPGTAPCIILSGHDGDMYPSDIADRNHGCPSSEGCDWSKDCSNPDESQCRAVTFNDENTQDMARRALDVFANFTGGRCHLVVNRLARIKLDPNREIEEGAQFDSTAEAAHAEFHSYATAARNTVTSNCGKGLVVDFHGHSHPEARIEVGYKLTSTNLRESDADLDNLSYTSSIKNMPTHTNTPFSEIIRGTNSMGELFERETHLNATGYLSVPSPVVNSPAVGESYFQGGYNLEQHGSQNGGSIDAVQIEFPRYLRDDYWEMQEDMLTAFGEVVLPEYLQAQYSFGHPGSCDLLI